MTCGGCAKVGKYGTVWFNHRTKKWVHGVGSCRQPEPKTISTQPPGA